MRKSKVKSYIEFYSEQDRLITEANKTIEMKYMFYNLGLFTLSSFVLISIVLYGIAHF